jgi:hypothetical protein
VTVGKPQKFKPSEFAVVQKSKRYVKFPVTVVNKSHKSIDLGLTYISVQSANKEADQVFDSLIGLKGPLIRRFRRAGSWSSTSDSPSRIQRILSWNSRSMTTLTGQVSCTPPSSNHHVVSTGVVRIHLVLSVGSCGVEPARNVGTEPYIESVSCISV